MKTCTLIFGLALVAAPAFGQSSPQQNDGSQAPSARAAAADTLTAPAASSQDTTGISGGELVLGEINIEAIIEKPNVDIIPSRVKPNVEDVAFIDRSFEHELKEIPKNFLLYDEALDSPKKLDQLFQLLRKKKSK